MRTLNPETTALLFIDFQTRLMRVIEDADAVIANAKRLLDAARSSGRAGPVHRAESEGSRPHG